MTQFSLTRFFTTQKQKRSLLSLFPQLRGLDLRSFGNPNNRSLQQHRFISHRSSTFSSSLKVAFFFYRLFRFVFFFFLLFCFNRFTFYFIVVFKDSICFWLFCLFDLLFFSILFNCYRFCLFFCYV